MAKDDWKQVPLLQDYKQALAFYQRVLETNDVTQVRLLCLRDRFFLLTMVLGVSVANHPWVFERCREVEADPDEHLDLWSRGHFKSTIITYAGIIQEILRNPEIKICIFSYKADSAKLFVRQVLNAFSNNQTLLRCFPDILYPEANKGKGDIQWSQEGIVVKRISGSKDPTLCGSGLVEGMRTGGHFDLLVYDDVVVPESVNTSETIKKTNDAVSMSQNLGTMPRTRHWYIGTRYAVHDTYDFILQWGTIKERRHTCVDENGNPVLLPMDEYIKKKKEMTPKDWASQMMQEPTAEGELSFREEDWQTYDNRGGKKLDWSKMNRVMFCDQANSKNVNSDYTVIQVWGLNHDRNYYYLGGIRRRLNLKERGEWFMKLHRKFRPHVAYVEQVALASDREYIMELQERQNYRFVLKPIIQRIAKMRRIQRLIPAMREGRIYWMAEDIQEYEDGTVHDVMIEAKKELLDHPHGLHDDFIDCAANLFHEDIHLEFPVEEDSDIMDFNNEDTYNPILGW
jgi:phage terminase large subunit-like protein